MIKSYEVRIIPAQPAYGDRGSIVDVVAANKKEAVSKARKENDRHRFYDRLDGRLIYTATEAND